MSKTARGISRRQVLQGIGGSLATLGFAACEPQPAPVAPIPEEVETAVPVPTRRPYVERVEVELMVGSVAGWEEGDFRELLRRFHSYYPGIRIRLDIDTQGEGQLQRLVVRLAAGIGIDVAHIAGQHLKLVLMFSPLDDFVKADESFETGAYYARLVDYYSTPRGGLWCLPWSYATELLYYNRQHFAEVGIPHPNHNWTWDDFLYAARTLTKSSGGSDVPEKWGAEFRLESLDFVLRSFGGGFQIGGFENPAEIHAGNVAALQFLADLVLKERVHPYPSLGLSGGFAQGKVSMAFLPEWATVKLNAVENLDYDVAPIPQGPAGSVTSCAIQGVAMGNYYCPHPDHAWEVMKWFAHADYGEWDIARTFLIPNGIPIALRAANEFSWAKYHERPASRHLILQNFETAMVPFSDSLWWPHLSEFGWVGRNYWKDLRQVFEGSISIEDLVMELGEDWGTEREIMAEELSRDYTRHESCYGY